MTTLQIGFDDWDTLDVYFLGGRLWIASATLSSTPSGSVITKAKAQRFELPKEVQTLIQVPPTAEGQAYFMQFAVRGFSPSEYYFSVPDTGDHVTLVQLLENYQVNPSNLEPLPTAPPSIQAELDDLQSQIDGISAGILPGGDTGQVLTKNSDTDGDASWQSFPAYVEGYQYNQTTPLATWTINLPDTWTRMPDVTIYTDEDEIVEADVTASTTQVSIMFPSPFTGYAILT